MSRYLSLVFSLVRGSLAGPVALCLLCLASCAAAGTAAAGGRAVLILGDSLSAGYGMALEQGWTARLQRRLVRQGYDYRVVNASISGETAHGARARLPVILARHQKIAIAIVELGGNDGLRGAAVAEIEANLREIIRQLQARQAAVLLVRMSLPPNYGHTYIERFRALYPRLSRQTAAGLTAFGLEEIVRRPGMMQPDGIHPTAAAQRLMLDNVWDDLLPLLERRPEGENQ